MAGITISALLIRGQTITCTHSIYNTLYSAYEYIIQNIDVTLDESAGPESNPFDYRFIYWMARNKGLTAIPPTAFYSGPNKHLAEKFIRLCFIKARLCSFASYNFYSTVEICSLHISRVYYSSLQY